MAGPTEGRGAKATGSGKFPEPVKGDTRDKVAAFVGVSGRTLSRRHLTREQRRELVLRLRQQSWSLRRIAERLRISDGTVRNDLGVAGAQNYAPVTVTGADGKRYPAGRRNLPRRASRSRRIAYHLGRPVNLKDKSSSGGRVSGRASRKRRGRLSDSYKA